MKSLFLAAILATFLQAPAVAEPQPDAEKLPRKEEVAPATVDTIQPPPPFRRRAPAKPDYILSLSDDKKVIHLMGAFASGISGELKNVLKQNPGAQTIVLSSPGGSMIDGFAVEKIIRQHGLNTHVELMCASACTEAFWGGKKRTLAKGARLGYHQATRGFFGIPFPLGDEKQAPPNLLWQKLYRERGLSDGFIDKATSTLNRDMWFPTQDMLLAEKIVTAVVTDARLGIALNGSWDSAAAMERELLNGKLWDYLRNNRPKIYYNAAHQAWVGWRFSRVERKPLDLAEESVVGAILKNADQLPDTLVLRLIAVEQALWAAQSDVVNKSCQPIVFAQTSFAIAPRTNSLKSDQRRALLEEIVQTLGEDVTIDKSRSDKAQASLLEFWAEMVVHGDFDSADVSRNFCKEPVNYYDVLLELPESKRLEYFRALAVVALHPMPMAEPDT